MKKTKSFAAGLMLSAVLLMGAGCASSAPLTEEQQAEKYNMTLEEYRDQKDAAARMNMTIEEHTEMTNEGGDMKMDGEM